MYNSETQNRFAQVLEGLNIEFSYSRNTFHLKKQNINICEFSADARMYTPKKTPLHKKLFIHQAGKVTTDKNEDCSIVQCSDCSMFYFVPKDEAQEANCPNCQKHSKKYLSKDGRIPGWFGKTINYIIDEDEAFRHVNSLCSDSTSDIENIINRLKGEPTYIKVSDSIINEVKQLISKYPNMKEVIDYFVINLTASKFRKNCDLSFMPVVLIGSAGCGKSSFVADLCKILMGKPALKIDLGNSVSSITLSGTDPAYSQSKNGIIIESMYAEEIGHPLKNPVIHFDEIDKLPTSGKDCAVNVFYSLLEPNTAFRFFDNFLGVNVDASGINYIFTGNTLEGIPIPIRNRLKVFNIQDYSHEQLRDIVMDSFYSTWININHIQEDYIPEVLSTEIKERILTLAEDSPRRIHDAIKTVFIETITYDDSEHHIISLFSPDQLYKGWKKFRGKRSFAKTPWTLPTGFEKKESGSGFSLEKYLGTYE